MSNELGARHPKSASFSVVAVTTLSFLVALVFAILVLIFRYELSYIFTGGTEVSEAVADLSPFLAISILLNGIQPVLSGNESSSFCFSEISYSTVIFFDDFFEPFFFVKLVITYVTNSFIL